MIEIAADLYMGWVDVSAGLDIDFTIRSCEPDGFSIIQQKQIPVVGIDESNSALSPFHVPVQQILFVAVDIGVVVAFAGIQPEHIAVIFGISPEAVVLAVSGLEGCLIKGVAVGQHFAPVLQDIAKLRIKPELIHHPVEFFLESICFQTRHMIIPTGGEGRTVPIQPSPEMADAPGLAHDLLALGVAVFSFLRCHGSNG